MLASVYPTHPVAKTKFFSGKPETITWRDDSHKPYLEDMQHMKIELYNGTVSLFVLGVFLWGRVLLRRLENQYETVCLRLRSGFLIDPSSDVGVHCYACETRFPYRSGTYSLNPVETTDRF